MSFLDWLFGVNIPEPIEETWTWKLESIPKKRKLKPRRVVRKSVARDNTLAKLERA